MSTERKAARYRPKKGVEATFKWTVGSKEFTERASHVYDI